MKSLNLLYGFLGGALIGAAAAILFAPEKGENVRSKIKGFLKKKGIKCTDAEIDALVAELTGDKED